MPSIQPSLLDLKLLQAKLWLWHKLGQRGLRFTPSQAAALFAANPARFLRLPAGTPDILTPGQWHAHEHITVEVAGHAVAYVQGLRVDVSQGVAEVLHLRTAGNTQKRGVGRALVGALREALREQYPGLVRMEFVVKPGHQGFFARLGAVHRGRTYLNGGHQIWELHDGRRPRNPEDRSEGE